MVQVCLLLGSFLLVGAAFRVFDPIYNGSPPKLVSWKVEMNLVSALKHAGVSVGVLDGVDDLRRALSESDSASNSDGKNDAIYFIKRH